MANYLVEAAGALEEESRNTLGCVFLVHWPEAISYCFLIGDIFLPMCFPCRDTVRTNETPWKDEMFCLPLKFQVYKKISIYKDVKILFSFLPFSSSNPKVQYRWSAYETSISQCQSPWVLPAVSLGRSSHTCRSSVFTDQPVSRQTGKHSSWRAVSKWAREARVTHRCSLASVLFPRLATCSPNNHSWGLVRSPTLLAAGPSVIALYGAHTGELWQHIRVPLVSQKERGV